jgi:aminoglycoside phosphotransferase (APT) family kinase protein
MLVVVDPQVSNNASGVHGTIVADELLIVLRQVLGRSVSYLEPPTKLSGGFYTANYAFRLADGPPGWQGRLVLRLFPDHAPSGLARREAILQQVAVSQGIAAPRVLRWVETRRLAGRDWFVMERLEGRPLLGGTELGAIVAHVPTLVGRLPALTAQAQLDLHRIDPAPVIDALGERDAGVSRWLDLLAGRVDIDAPGMGDGVGWLVARRPPPKASPVLCHGDLWGGNLLVRRGQVTGVIDWTLATVAEPAFEVGFTAMGLWLAPMPVPRPLLAALRAGSRWLLRRYLRTYRRGSGADLSTVPYYEALRCAIELTGVIAYRNRLASGSGPEGQPTWDTMTDDMIAYFRQRTGVALRL